MGHVTTMFIRDFSFQKVHIALFLPFCPSLIASSFGSSRIRSNSKRMVRLQLFCFNLDLHPRGFRAVLHDPEIYPDPEEFKPEQFLNRDGSFRDDPRIALAFGAGKRICPGREFAEATLFIVASSVISIFNLTKAQDENGYDIPVRVATSVQSGLLM